MKTLDNVVQPQPSESPEMEALRDAIDHPAAAYTPCLIGPDGSHLEIPSSVFRVLQTVVHGMAAGMTITVVPSGKQLTTQQAAEMLHVSRPHLIKLLDEGQIPFTRTGTHRRIDVDEVLRYRDQRTDRRRGQLRDLTQTSRDLAGKYD